MLWNHVWLGVLWVAYCVLHSVLASIQVKAFLQKRTGAAFRHYRLAYTVFAAAGLGLIVWFGLGVQSVLLFQTNVLTLIIGGTVALTGVGVMFICVKKYFLNLSGLRSLAQEETTPVLEIGGVHRFVRHPLYLGTFLFLWGLFISCPTASLLISNVIITGYTLVGIVLEERKLVRQFGSQYQTYQQTVPKLIPNFSSTGKA